MGPGQQGDCATPHAVHIESKEQSFEQMAIPGLDCVVVQATTSSGTQPNPVASVSTHTLSSHPFHIMHGGALNFVQSFGAVQL